LKEGIDLNNKVIFFDTTLRDGEQTPGVNLNLAEKLEIARQLEKMGVDVIEAGFPAASPGDAQSVAAIAAQVKNSVVCGLSRCVDADIKKCYEAVRGAVSPRIHVFLATSPIHMKYKLKMSEEDVLRRAVEGVRLAKSYVDDVEFSPEDGSRSEPAFLYRVLEAVIDAGATTVNIPDTVGYATPDEFYEFISGIMNNVPNIDKAVVSVHCHNDLGLAVANSLAGIRAGARQVECAINGLGERAGNAALEELVMTLNTRKDVYGLENRIDTQRIYRASRVVSSTTGVEVQPNKAIVGNNAFRHESGIHQHGVLNNPTTYEIMTPESIGIQLNSMVLGKHSGRHAFGARLAELGYTVSEEELSKLFDRFKNLADRKKEINDRDLEALMGGAVAESSSAYALESFQLQSGNRIQSIASVCLQHDEQVSCEAAVGDGPVDAAFNAISRIVGNGFKLESYSIKGVTEGADALGEVTVRVSYDGVTHMGKGLASDVIEASVLAYINALNRFPSVK
jgi:2-isopropylmalate synthase